MKVPGLNKKNEPQHRIGLFFGSSTGNSQTIARIIATHFQNHEIEIHDVMDTNPLEILKFDKLIFGIPTWNKKEIQDDWHEFLMEIDKHNFKKKKIALYGLGDQHTYKENFLDGMGKMYQWLVSREANIIGRWPIDGYTFERSGAIQNGKFVGLAIDEDVQYELTAQRVEQWVKQLKKEFEE